MVTDGSPIYAFLLFVDKSPGVYKLKDIVSCMINSELKSFFGFCFESHTKITTHWSHKGSYRSVTGIAQFIVWDADMAPLRWVPKVEHGSSHVPSKQEIPHPSLEAPSPDMPGPSWSL